MQIAAIDIGGTSIKYGIVTNEGEIEFKNQTPTEAYKGGTELVKKINKICDELRGRFEVKGVAISSAGQIDSKHGTVVFATETIPGYTGVKVSELVEAHTGLPVTVENDVNCTALGEFWKGAAKGVQNFICVTIGTGIGGALFLDGKLFTGAHFSAGEIGHMNLYPQGRACTCGNNGCYEQYASSTALSRLVTEEFGEKMDLREFFEYVKRGDTTSTAVFQTWLEDLTTGLRSLVHTLNPELIIIGGGISGQGEFLLNKIKGELFRNVMPNHRESLGIKIAEHRNDANLLGAVHHFLISRGA